LNNIRKRRIKMKKLFTIMFAFALVFAFTAAYAADESGTMSGSGTSVTPDRSTTGTDSSASDLSVSSSSALKASDLIGSNVENRQGESLGEISDLAIDPQSGRIAFALISQGGVLGVGTKFTPVPMNAITFSDNKAILDVSKDKLANAPSFDKDQWPNVSDRTQIGETYRYFGVTPYWESDIQMQPGMQDDIHRDMQQDNMQQKDAPTDMNAPGRIGY
jgi:sporulation protein YlmC with PRC-barrel domain